MYVFVNPWIYDFAAFDYWAKPLGLLYLSARFRKEGRKVKLIDCLDMGHPAMAPHRDGIRRRSFGRIEYYREEVEKPEPLRGIIPRKYKRYGSPVSLFKKALSNIKRPEAFFVTSAMTYWYPGVKLAVEIIKNTHPGVPVILGGIYAGLCTGHALRHSGADKVIARPGELSAGPYAPAAAWDWDTYPALDLYSSLSYVPLLTSLGCSCRCSYCASSILQPRYEGRDIVSAADEIEYWHISRGTRDFVFYDDALLIDAEHRFLPLMEEIIRRNLDCRFHTPNGLHVREISIDAARLMHDAGFKTLRLSLEASDPLFHSRHGDKIGRGDLENAADNLLKAGYSGEEIKVYILAGLPGQHRDEVIESIRYTLDLGLRTKLAEYSPIPGTELWPAAVKASPFDLEGEPLFHNNTVLPCRREGFGPDDLEEIKRVAGSTPRRELNHRT